MAFEWRSHSPSAPESLLMFPGAYSTCPIGRQSMQSQHLLLSLQPVPAQCPWRYEGQVCLKKLKPQRRWHTSSQSRLQLPPSSGWEASDLVVIPDPFSQLNVQNLIEFEQKRASASPG